MNKLLGCSIWQAIAAQVKNLVVKVHHVDVHVPKHQAITKDSNHMYGLMIEGWT